MFGRSKPVVLESYGHRRPRRGVPGWLIVLSLGIAAGIGGVLIVQHRYLPPRLSAEASTRLRADYQQADAERQRLAREQSTTAARLATQLEHNRKLVAALGESQSTVQGLRDDLSTVVDTLPPDPRGAPVEIRSARFVADSGAMAYDLVLTREPASAVPISASLQFAIVGVSARGADSTVASKPVPVSIGSHEVARGSVSLPDGFKPKQATVQVVDGKGKSLGMRVLYVK